MADALPLRGKLANSMGCYSGSQLFCPLCEAGVETAPHLFLECHVSRYVWRRGIWPLRVELFTGRLIGDWLSFVLNSRNMPQVNSNQWQEFILYVAQFCAGLSMVH